MSTLAGISVETCVLLCHFLNQSPLVQLNLFSKVVLTDCQVRILLKAHEAHIK